MVEKYYNENGELGVLISPGFGAGWSSWNCDECEHRNEDCLCDISGNDEPCPLI